MISSGILELELDDVVIDGADEDGGAVEELDILEDRVLEILEDRVLELELNDDVDGADGDCGAIEELDIVENGVLELELDNVVDGANENCVAAEELDIVEDRVLEIEGRSELDEIVEVQSLALDGEVKILELGEELMEKEEDGREEDRLLEIPELVEDEGEIDVKKEELYDNVNNDVVELDVIAPGLLLENDEDIVVNIVLLELFRDVKKLLLKAEVEDIVAGLLLVELDIMLELEMTAKSALGTSEMLELDEDRLELLLETDENVVIGVLAAELDVMPEVGEVAEEVEVEEEEDSVT